MREGEDVVHMVAEAMAVAWGKTRGSGMAAGQAAVAPDHPVEAIPTPMVPIVRREHTAEVNVAAPRVKEHLDAIPAPCNIPAATV